MGSIRIHSRSQESPRQRELAALAARQHGVVSRRQLLELGFGEGAIKGQLRTGHLHLLHRGVYVVGHTALAPRARWMGAVLACGPGAVLSHVSAAACWGMLATARAVVDVTAARSRHARPGIDVHRSRALDARDTSAVEGIPVTTVARTLLDLAEVVPARRLEAAFEQAERLRMLDAGAVADQIARSRGRRGTKPLASLLGAVRHVETDTRSELERRFVRLCRDHRLPPPSMNATVAGHAVDAHWPGRPLVVELDSRGFHLNARAFEADRVRDADLLLAGYRVLRVTERRLRREPQRVAATIAALLER